MNNKCKICNSSNLNEIILKEKMFGTNDEFCYLHCNLCGCYQISEMLKPEELSKYYPDNYYSFNLSSNKTWKAPIKKAVNIIAQITESYKFMSKTFYRKDLSFRALARTSPPQ